MKRGTVLWVGQQSELDRELVGGKAFSLNRMRQLKLPVPPAFVLTTEVCRRFHANGARLDDDVVEAVRQAVATLEERTGRVFGGVDRPLLVSVRSGAARSMPGMMDTVLNLGLNPRVEQALRELTGDPRYAADTHARFIDQFARVTGSPPPQEPWDQLMAAVAAVFGSWNSTRAKAYRSHHGIAESGGTAVTIQAMVFGNLDARSGTGVLFTRNPLTGDSTPYGEWLPGGQGEDVVSGRFDPLPLERLGTALPEVHAELLAAAATLEIDRRDVQDIEFTVEAGKLWLLQSRPAKRSPDAALRLASALVKDGIVTVEQALGLVGPEQIAAVGRPRIAPEARLGATVLARGEPACPGTASGQVALEVDAAVDLAERGDDVVLVRPTTEPDDVAGMIGSVAIVTEVGGSTSHAAVVSRELGIPCVVGCGAGTAGELAGREVTVDGSTGEIFDGRLPMAPCSEAEIPELAELAGWARERTGLSAGSLESVFAAVLKGH